MSKTKLISAVWFGLLATVPGVLITLQSEREELSLGVLLFFTFAAPWGYLLGDLVVNNKGISANGLTGAVFAGFWITVLSYLSWAAVMLVINFDFSNITESILSFLGGTFLIFIVSAPVTIPFGMLGSVILWLAYSFYINRLTGTSISSNDFWKNEARKTGPNKRGQ